MRSHARPVVVLALAAFAAVAHAGHTYSVTIVAESSLGTNSATFTGSDLFLRAGTVDTTPLGSNLGASALGWAWNQSASSPLNGAGGVLGMVGRTATSFIDDPVVLLSFNVQAGAVDTTFTITSIAVFTDPLELYQITAASAAITATDGGAGNGVSMAGAQPSSNIFAYRNNGADVGYLLNSGSASGFLPLNSGSTFSSPTAVSGISAISSSFRFTLSANDTASGTSLYRIDPVPAPAASALLAAAGLAAGRRRRR